MIVSGYWLLLPSLVWCLLPCVVNFALCERVLLDHSPEELEMALGLSVFLVVTCYLGHSLLGLWGFSDWITVQVFALLAAEEINQMVLSTVCMYCQSAFRVMSL